MGGCHRWFRSTSVARFAKEKRPDRVVAVSPRVMCACTRVLLVNDDDDALFLLGRAVRRAIPDVEIALLRDGPSALAYCAEHHVDAVVTDNTMPRMDGITLARSIRQRDARVPILMVTNSTHLAREAA